MSDPTTFIPTSPTVPALTTSAWTLNTDTSSNVTDTEEDPSIGMASSTESVYAVLLGVSVIAVVVMILLIMIVVLRFMAHQKGTYYTQEENLAFKSDPEMQEVTDDLEDPENPEEEEP